MVLFGTFYLLLICCEQKLNLLLFCFCSPIQPFFQSRTFISLCSHYWWFPSLRFSFYFTFFMFFFSCFCLFGVLCVNRSLTRKIILNYSTFRTTRRRRRRRIKSLSYRWSFAPMAIHKSNLTNTLSLRLVIENCSPPPQILSTNIWISFLGQDDKQWSSGEGTNRCS